MARMFPRKLPPDVENNPLRATELKVYHRLQHQLSDDWVAFYSRPWLGLTPTGDEVDGECDFVIAHALHGVLCVEVKGGSVSWNPDTDRWTSRDRHNIPHYIKDPVAQARHSKHQILEHLKTLPGLGHRRLSARHGVIFPDCEAQAGYLGTDRPRFIFCCGEEFGKNLAGWVVSRFGRSEERSGGEEPPGPEGMKALEALFATPLTFRIPLGPAARAEGDHLDILTQQQYHLLGTMDSMERVCIQGGAGTGKTVLATRLAEQLAGSGLRTLLVCYNEALAARLSGRCQGISNLLVCSFHSLCGRVLTAANRHPESSGGDTDRSFDVTLPEAVLEIDPAAGLTQFDAIVVDEGQDFRSLWWAVLERLLSDSGPKLLRVFLDCNQQVYAGAGGIPKDLHLIPFHLSWNLRNTREVHNAAYHYYSGRAVTCNGPPGEPPIRVIVGAGSSLRKTLDDLVIDLIEREALAPEEITVLVCDAGMIAMLAPEGSLGGAPIQNASQEQSGYLTVDTVRRFKGLESLVLIVVVDEELGGGAELCYVALSRGRTRVFLVGGEGELDRLQFKVIDA